jgi:hypothetical protein
MAFPKFLDNLLRIWRPGDFNCQGRSEDGIFMSFTAFSTVSMVNTSTLRKPCLIWQVCCDFLGLYSILDKISATSYAMGAMHLERVTNEQD